MTGRELIIYILENGLEDEPLYKDGRIVGFMTAHEAAEKFGVGWCTIYVWANNNLLPSVRIGDQLYIPIHAERPTGLIERSKIDGR